MTQLSAFILGATGETGKELLLALAANQSISKLVLIGRRKQDLEQDTFKNVEQRVIDFDKIGEFSDSFQGFDVGYCCLGTTKGKAGKEGFFKVDHDYVVESAKLAKEGGCKHFHLVTAQGANKNSWFLYPKTKGQAEAAVEDLGFDRLSIYRPALLLCDRQERRSLEKVAQRILGTIDHGSKMSIPTKSLAQAMMNNTFTMKEKSIEIIENAGIIKLSHKEA